MKSFPKNILSDFIEALSEKYRLILPTRFSDGSINFSDYNKGDTADFSSPPLDKPHRSFFAQIETVLSTAIADAEVDDFIIFGLTTPDIKGLMHLDRFFGSPPIDDIYFKKRSKAYIISASGFLGNDIKFRKPIQVGADIELFFEREDIFISTYTDRGESLLKSLNFQFFEKEPIPPKAPDIYEVTDNIIKRASDILMRQELPASFWEDIAKSCISCTGCNMVCPTCSCFSVEDQINKNFIERLRCWDSCQFDAFMREAGGHNPLGTQALRTRRRIHHKLVADRKNFGEIGCTGCLRCDAACPTGIGMLSVAKMIVKNFEQ